MSSSTGKTDAALAEQNEDKIDTKDKVGGATEASNKKTVSAGGGGEEDDLDDLDDLLDDFADDVLSKPPGATVATESVKEEKQAPTTDEPLNDEFKTNIDDLIKDLKIEDPDTKEQFEELVKQFEKDRKEEVEAATEPQNFDEIMKQTMERLKKSGETIDEQIKNDQSGSNGEDVLSQLLAGLGGAGGAGGGDFDMSKLLVDMLEQLSSKEVLYEPIKDLNTKFPDYLKEKKDSLSEEQYANYSKQYDITNDILAVFESSDYDDLNTEKRDNVNRLLESLQELGQPPTDLVGDAKDFPGFGGFGGGKDGDLDFDTGDLPKDVEKNLEEGCKQT